MLETTSLTFMLLWVPDPVCQTETGNCASNSPPTTRKAAAAMASDVGASSKPRSRLTQAPAHLTQASAWTTGNGMRCSPMAKNLRLRAVCAAHSASSGTSMGPKLSCSVRVLAM